MQKKINDERQGPGTTGEERSNLSAKSSLSGILIKAPDM